MASGETLITFDPRSHVPPASNFATMDLRNVHSVLDFDGAGSEYAFFEEVMPRHYAGGGITLTVGTTWSSATSGVTRWGFSWERHQDGSGDLDADSFAATQYLQVTANGTSGVMVYAATAFTNGAAIDSIAVGEHFRLLVCRDPVNDADTITTDAELWFVELKET